MTVAVFVNPEKAFDKIWYDGLLLKLKNYNVPLIKIIGSFLSHRTYHVRETGLKSSKKSINAGVPQSSCLSPLLFALYLNDMSTIPGVHLNLFADDTMVYATSIEPQHTINLVQT